MQPRISNGATAVVQIANQEATRLGNDYIGTEHVLVGLTQDQGIAGQVLQEFGVRPTIAQQEVEKSSRTGGTSTSSKEARLKNTVEWALEEARRLSHLQMGPEHLLLGLLRDPHCRACEILVKLGVDLERLRTTALGRIPPGSPEELIRLRALEQQFESEPRVQELKHQISQLQHSKEQTVAAMDFHGAKSFLDQQRAKEVDLENLYDELDRQSDLPSEQ
jgi:hypothetical protein